MAWADMRGRFEGLLSRADVQIDGSRSWDLRLHDPRVFRRVLAEGSLGLGEAYMDGWWDCDRLDELFHRVCRAELDRCVWSGRMLLDGLWARLFNLQRLSRAFQVARRHYDLGNDLFRAMLGERLIYSCGYWEEVDTLDEAQEAKLNLIARKLHLEPGMRVLDVGCGWGGTAQFLAQRYGVEVVGITVSRDQVAVARELCRGLPVKIHLQDYRNLEGRFDRILSVGMFEHVGVKNYRTFMKTVRAHLAEDGLFLLHTIGTNRRAVATDPWIVRYIFPNSMLPSPRQVGAALEGIFILEDWHNFGVHYDRTLLAWFDNFARNWSRLQDSYGERFFRMWKYYLLSCAGAFRARSIQVWQVILSPQGVPGGYRPAIARTCSAT